MPGQRKQINFKQSTQPRQKYNQKLRQQCVGIWLYQANIRINPNIIMCVVDMVLDWSLAHHVRRRRWLRSIIDRPYRLILTQMGWLQETNQPHYRYCVEVIFLVSEWGSYWGVRGVTFRGEAKQSLTQLMLQQIL